MEKEQVIILPGPAGPEHENRAIEARIDAGFDPATGRRASRAAIEEAGRVYEAVIAALMDGPLGFAFENAREIAEGAYKTALIRHDHPFIRR